MKRWTVVWLILLTIGQIILLVVFGATFQPVELSPTPETIRVVETVVQEVVKEVPVTVSPTERPKPAIIFFDGGWDSLRVLNGIAMFIIQHGYGYPVTQDSMSVDTMLVYLPLGDIHVVMEVWWLNSEEWYNTSVSAGRVLDLGAVYETSTQGIYVPRYVIEGDPARNLEAVAPDLEAVTDLPQYWEAFKFSPEAEKGQWFNCPINLRCHKMMKVKAEAYGLNEAFTEFVPQTKAEMDATIEQTYEKGQPFITYYWEPTWLMHKYDMVKLTEPAYNHACWVKIERATNQQPVGTVDEACDFPSQDIRKMVYSDILADAPEVALFLNKMFVGSDRLSELDLLKMESQSSPDAVAVYYLQNYQAEWRHWVPAEIFEKVKTALP